ncbi:MAG: amidase [Acidimicrobiia bacterium]|nr:amidase [Acidimicrobiia bacterium]
MDVPDFRAVSVERLAGMVRERVVSAAAVTEHALERIAALNPRINAFVMLDADAARSQAEGIDERLEAGEDPGPLAGVPIGVKDLADAAGLPTTRGAMHLRDAPAARHDSVEVARLRAAGCVVVGKTNTAEFGCLDDTYNPAFGATLNPWNLAYSPGGSSGGTAAAIAAGMIPLGTGSDAGGSIRTPSAACGLSGMKTSQGRVPAGPPPLGLLDLCCVGPMARRIRDVALCLDVVVGPDPVDLRSLPAPTHPWRRALDEPQPPVRVLWAPSFDGGPVDSEVRAACAAAVELLATAGVEVIEAGRLLDAGMDLQDELYNGGGLVPTHQPLFGTEHWPNVTAAISGILERHFTTATVSSQYQARLQASALSVQLAEAMTGFDVMLTPMCAGQLPLSRQDGTINGESTANWLRFASLATLTRRPAGTVCCGFTQQGVPVGIQVIGHQLDDLGVLSALAVLEDLLGLGPVADLDLP